MAGIEQRVELCRIFQHNGFQPSFRGTAIERLVGVSRERAAVQVQLMQQAFKRSFVRGGEQLAGISQAEKYALSGPTRELHSVKCQRDFVCGGWYAALDGVC